MDIEHEISSETLNESLLESGGPHIHGSATLGTKSADKTDEPGVARIRKPLTILFRPREALTASLRQASLEVPAPARQTSARIAIKAKRRILFIAANDIVALEAKGNYVVLRHRSGSHVLRESISTVEEKLNLQGFVRIHRSVMVNAAWVEEIQPWSTGEYVLRMRGGREYTVTRSYKKNLQRLAQSWIGATGFDTE